MCNRDTEIHDWLFWKAAAASLLISAIWVSAQNFRDSHQLYLECSPVGRSNLEIVIPCISDNLCTRRRLVLFYKIRNLVSGRRIYILLPWESDQALVRVQGSLACENYSDPPHYFYIWFQGMEICSGNVSNWLLSAWMIARRWVSFMQQNLTLHKFFKELRNVE